MICVQTVNYSFAAKEVSISRIQNYKGTMTKTVLELVARAGSVGSQRFHNHGEGPYYGLCRVKRSH